MKKLLLITTIFTILTFRIFAETQNKTPGSSENLSSYTNEELFASLKLDAHKIGEKCKILSKRYYEKGKVAAKDGKTEMARQYDSCAEAFKEMGDGFEQNKTDLVSKGKDNYKKAVAKMKELSDSFFDNVDSNKNSE